MHLPGVTLANADVAKYAMCTVCGYTIAIPGDANAGDYRCPTHKIPLVATVLGRDFARSHLLYAIDKGDAYASSIRVAGVADNGTLRVLLSNPAGSPRNICWTALVVASEGKAYLDLYVNVTVNVAGTPLYQTQKFAGSPKTSVADTEYNGTYTYGVPNLVYQFLVPGGSGAKTVGGQATDAELAKAIPGVNVLIVLTNKGGAVKDMSIRVVWVDCDS